MELDHTAIEMEVESTTEIETDHAHAIGGFPVHFTLVGILIAMLLFATYVANKARHVGLSYSANFATVVVLASVALTFILELIDELYPFGFHVIHGDHVLPIIGTSIFIWLFVKTRKVNKTWKEIKQDRKS